MKFHPEGNIILFCCLWGYSNPRRNCSKMLELLELFSHHPKKRQTNKLTNIMILKAQPMVSNWVQWTLIGSKRFKQPLAIRKHFGRQWNLKKTIILSLRYLLSVRQIKEPKMTFWDSAYTAKFLTIALPCIQFPWKQRPSNGLSQPAKYSQIDPSMAQPNSSCTRQVCVPGMKHCKQPQGSFPHRPPCVLFTLLHCSCSQGAPLCL